MYMLIGLILASQIENEAALRRMDEVQIHRNGKAPSSAEYELNGEPSPTVLGRITTCRAYLDTDGSYFVEQISEHWVSRVWLLKDRMIWRYSEPPEEYAYVGPITLTKSPEEFLEKKGFIVSRMSVFDEQCRALIKSSANSEFKGDNFEGVVGKAAIHLNFNTNGFEIARTSKPAMTIKYRSAASLPEWKRDTDLLLKDVDTGKIPTKRLGESFSFEAVMTQISEEKARRTKLTSDELLNSARVHGYVLPIGPRISVRSAISSGQGTFLELKIDVGEKRFELAQYRLDVMWKENGELANSPISKNTIIKSEKFSTGVLLLTSSGKGATPSTCFIHRSGQTLAIAEDLFEDKDFRDLIAALRSGKELK